MQMKLLASVQANDGAGDEADEVDQGIRKVKRRLHDELDGPEIEDHYPEGKEEDEVACEKRGVARVVVIVTVSLLLVGVHLVDKVYIEHKILKL